jgi:proton glutamate symport protein
MPSDRRPARLSLGTKAVIGLVAGLAAGAAIARIGHPMLLSAGAAVEVVGTLWINAILMTILPLIVAKLVVSIAGLDDPRVIGRSGWKAAVAFLILLTSTAAVAAAVMPTVFAWLPIARRPQPRCGAPPSRSLTSRGRRRRLR